MWGGCVPTTEVLKKAYAWTSEKKSVLKTRAIMQTTGTILCGDHTFSVAKVPFQDHQRIFEAMFSVMNEHGQVIGYYMTNSKSLEEIRPELKLLAERYEPDCGPYVWFSDNCCWDRRILSEVFPSLSDNAPLLVNLPKLKFHGKIVEVMTHEQLERVCETLCVADRVGFDIEWVVPLPGDEPNPVSVLQLCAIEEFDDSSSFCAIIRLSWLQKPIPQCLQDVLGDADITKYGVNIQGDVTRLMDDYGLRTNGFVDLTTRFQHLPVKSLEYLCQEVLRKSLDKSPEVVLSNWDVRVLTPEQTQYAANDAFASLRLGLKVEKTENAGAGNNTTMEVVEDNSNQYMRVLLDVFHFMDRYPVAKLHPLYANFITLLRDAILVPCEYDMFLARQMLAARGLSSSQIDAISQDYFYSNGRVRRRIPEASIVTRNVHEVLTTFREICPSYINDKVWKVHLNCLKHLNKGCLSDHPDVSLYFQSTINKDGVFKKMRCARGSSQLEGFHFYIANATAAKSMSAALYDRLLLDTVYRWNTDRAIAAQLQSQHHCYDPQLLESIHRLCENNKTKIRVSPLGGKFEMIKVSDKPLEKFGCSRILVEDVWSRLFADTDEDINPAELGLIEDEEADEQFNVIEYDEFHLDQALDATLQQTHLEVPTHPRIVLDEQLLRRVRVSPCPAKIRTIEEVTLFLQLFRAHILNDDNELDEKRADYQALEVVWNSVVLQKLQRCEDWQVKGFFKQYRLKCDTQLREFKELLVKRLRARALLTPHQDKLKKLYAMFRNHRDTPHRDPVLLGENVDTEAVTVLPIDDEVNLAETNGIDGESNLVETAGSSGDIQALITTHERIVTEDASIYQDVDRPAIVRKRKKEDLSAEEIMTKLIAKHGEELVQCVQNGVEVCSGCLRPFMINEEFTEGHVDRFKCRGMDKSEETIRKKNSATRDIRRGLGLIAKKSTVVDDVSVAQ
jgi:hypothetical protein